MPKPARPRLRERAGLTTASLKRGGLPRGGYSIEARAAVGVTWAKTYGALASE